MATILHFYDHGGIWWSTHQHWGPSKILQPLAPGHGAQEVQPAVAADVGGQGRGGAQGVAPVGCMVWCDAQVMSWYDIISELSCLWQVLQNRYQVINIQWLNVVECLLGDEESWRGGHALFHMFRLDHVALASLVSCFFGKNTRELDQALGHQAFSEMRRCDSRHLSTCLSMFISLDHAIQKISCLIISPIQPWSFRNVPGPLWTPILSRGMMAWWSVPWTLKISTHCPLPIVSAIDLKCLDRPYGWVIC